MNYFMHKENVETYKELVKDHDGSWLIKKLHGFLPKGALLLELGMGTGLDLKLLAKDYNVLGTDSSPIFIKDFLAKNTGIPVQQLDATNITINKNFDCIFSNKVLQHLTKEEFIASLKSQKEHLNKGGILFMTLWEGKHREELMFEGQLRFTYYTENDIRNIAENDFEILLIEHYNECDNNDSLLVVLQKK